MSKVSPGCRRITIDLPTDLYDLVDTLANEAPAIPTAEWIRRVIAHTAGYPMPPLKDRKRYRLRLDGSPKRVRSKLL
jgi:hypothetical protein